jgi:putative ABC transport system permease protein
MQDLKFAARMLRKNPAFTLVAVLTLALGIGANSAIFSVVNAVLLEPLPYHDPGSLLNLSAVNLQTKAAGIPLSYTKFTQIREQSHSLEGVAAYYPATLSMVTGRGAEAINAARVSSDFFSVLGISPARGRDFLPEEEVAGAADVAVISDGFWYSHYAADDHALGKSLTLDGKPATIIGILPARFGFPLQYPEPDLWLARVSDPPFLTPEQVRTGAGYLNVIGRLRSGETATRSQAELDTIDARYRSQFTGFVDSTKYGISTVPLQESLVGALRPGLAVLLAAVGFLLLIACANAANLLLARATTREREIAVRKALGATNLRLVRQLLMESVLLSFLGGMAGIGLAAASMPALRAFSPGSVLRLADTRLDAPVLLYSLLLCAVTAILFGLVPALQMAGKELHQTLKEGSRDSGGGHRGKVRRFLVVAELAVALVLMTGAGLLIEGFSQLMQVDPGFTSKNLMTFPVNLPAGRYARPENQALFYRQLIEQVKSLPGIQGAGLTSYLPLSGGARFVYFCPEGTLCQGIGKDPLTAVRQVSTNYFGTMRTPLVKGRVFTEQDTASAPLVVVVNQTIANCYWPQQNPIGKHLANSRDMLQREVVGVVADVKFSALNAANVEEMYLPLEQSPARAATLIVSAPGNPQMLVAAVRAKIAEVDPTLPVTDIASMEQIVSTSVAQPRLVAQFVGIFAGFALLLSAIGIYGVMSYTVSTRRQELGIRMSLGAQPRDIVKLVVGQGLRLALLGIAIGIAVSLALTRVLASQLFGVRTTDPFAFTAAAAVLFFLRFWRAIYPRGAQHASIRSWPFATNNSRWLGQFTSQDDPDGRSPERSGVLQVFSQLCEMGLYGSHPAGILGAWSM